MSLECNNVSTCDSSQLQRSCRSFLHVVLSVSICRGCATVGPATTYALDARTVDKVVRVWDDAGSVTRGLCFELRGGTRRGEVQELTSGGTIDLRDYAAVAKRISP